VPRVLVINPNSNMDVTRGIDGALAGLREGTGASVEVMGLQGTPHGIESQRDVDVVAAPVARAVAAADGRADAFVIACFSDPGLQGAREATRKPVLGIAASGMLTALGVGNAVGVISILASSLPRHWRYYRAMGIAERVAGDYPVGAGVAELADASAMGERMRDTGERLVHETGADVLVLGCAGMAQYRDPLEQALGVTVIDPAQAAVGLAITAASMGYRTL